MVILPSFYDFREIAFIRVIVLPECIYIGICNYHADIGGAVFLLGGKKYVSFNCYIGNLRTENYIASAFFVVPRRAVKNIISYYDTVMGAVTVMTDTGEAVAFEYVVFYSDISADGVIAAKINKLTVAVINGAV